MTVSPLSAYLGNPLYCKSLSELSESKSGDRCVPSDSKAGQMVAFSLDDIKADQCLNHGYPLGGLSADAFLIQNETPILVEFKTSSIKDDEWFRKIYDSIILLVELGVLTWAECREKLEFILVQKDVEKYTGYEGNPDRDARVLEGQIVKFVRRISPEAFESCEVVSG